MTRLNMKLTKENCRHWIVFPFKAYIIAVPAALLICEIAGRPVPASTPGTYYRFLEDGYVACLAVLLLDAMFSAFVQNKKEFRSAIIFVVLTLISMVAFYMDSLVATTR